LKGDGEAMYHAAIAPRRQPAIWGSKPCWKSARH
jgi:hypothetical protein